MFLHFLVSLCGFSIGVSLSFYSTIKLLELKLEQGKRREEMLNRHMEENENFYKKSIEELDSIVQAMKNDTRKYIEWTERSRLPRRTTRQEQDN